MGANLKSDFFFQSNIVAEDEHMDLFDELNGTSRVQRFEIGGIKMFDF